MERDNEGDLMQAPPIEHGPDNPRDWTTAHPSLLAQNTPHETAGVLRIHRAGRSGKEIMKALGLRGTSLMKQMQKAIDDESHAHACGRDIHDAPITKEE
jgi:hypothetical protein